MSILKQATKPADRMPIVTICGDSGLGKTSLAATFPNPIVIRAEDGLQGVPAAIRPDALPVVTSLEQLIEQMTALYKEEHKYKTIIIDSVTALERIFMQNVIDSDPKKPKSINQALGGYGAGLGAVATLHHRVGKLMSRSMPIKTLLSYTSPMPTPKQSNYRTWTRTPAITCASANAQ